MRDCGRGLDYTDGGTLTDDYLSGNRKGFPPRIPRVSPIWICSGKLEGYIYVPPEEMASTRTPRFISKKAVRESSRYLMEGICLVERVTL